jgi:hypothetical protein
MRPRLLLYLSLLCAGCSPQGHSPSALGDTWTAPPDGGSFDAESTEVFEPGPEPHQMGDRNHPFSPVMGSGLWALSPRVARAPSSCRIAPGHGR